MAAYLYQVPDDEGQRARLRAILDGILNESAVKKLEISTFVGFNEIEADTTDRQREIHPDREIETNADLIGPVDASLRAVSVPAATSETRVPLSTRLTNLSTSGAAAIDSGVVVPPGTLSVD